MTKANREMLTDETIEYFQNDFESKLNELYYFSLEALKARCYDEYEACIVYGDEPGHILAYGAKDYYWHMISPKKEELNLFAVEKGINIGNIREIAKGKWYLYCWCEYIIQMSKKMYELCGSILPQCIYCQNGVPGKCLWKQESIFQIPNVKSILSSEEIIDLEEVRYITDKIRQLCC